MERLREADAAEAQAETTLSRNVCRIEDYPICERAPRRTLNRPGVTRIASVQRSVRRHNVCRQNCRRKDGGFEADDRRAVRR
jgi:hypothetical protein